MLRKYNITYLSLSKRVRTVELDATSKYDAKKRLYLKNPKYEIIKVEEITDEGNKKSPRKAR